MGASLRCGGGRALKARRTDFLDCYEVLGLDSKANASEIRAVYRERAALTHPDCGGTVKDFDLVAKAYATLKDPRKRSDHDGERAVYKVAESADVFVDEVIVPFVRDDLVPFVGGIFGKLADFFLNKNDDRVALLLLKDELHFVKKSDDDEYALLADSRASLQNSTMRTRRRKQRRRRKTTPKKKTKTPRQQSSNIIIL